AAGHFLKEFVAEGVEWAHIDVAGPAYNSGSPWGYTPKAGTRVPVRTLAAVLADIAERGCASIRGGTAALPGAPAIPSATTAQPTRSVKTGQLLHHGALHVT